MTDTPPVTAVADVLDRAADLVEPAGGWTQDWFCKDADGSELDIGDSAAVCWCIRGAVLQASTGLDFGGKDPFDALHFALGLHSAGAIESWNDAPERTQPEVVAALRRAAMIARAGEA